MSLSRINEFRAAPGCAGKLRTVLASLLPYLEGCAGCEGVVLLVSEEDPEKFVVLERWLDKEAHAAALQGYPPDQMSAARDVLGAAPKGEFFRTL